MRLLRNFILVVLILLSASLVRAQDVSHVIVCNDGTTEIDVVTGTKIHGLFSGYTWEIEGWFKVPAGECGIVSNQNYRPRVYLAFAFTDSTGVWGWAKVKPESYSSGWKLTDMKLCAEKAEFTFRFPEGDQIPATQCKGERRFLIPASIDYDPQGNEVVGGNGGLVRGEFRVKFGPNDRAIPFGPQGSTGVTAPSPAKPADKAESDASDSLKTAGDILKALAKAAEEERLRQQKAEAAAAQVRLNQARDQQAGREEQNKRIKAAAAAGDPDAQVPAQMIARDEEENRKRWAGSHQSPAAYVPQWMGQDMVVTGTVSRVEVDPDPSRIPQWLTIYFKESPDATFVVCSPYPDMFQERVGLDLSVLIGKTLQAAGPVEGPLCGHKGSKGSIEVLESTQWQIH